MRYSLDGKVVWITGAAGGIGEALARKLYFQGATLVLTDMSLAAVNALASEFSAERVMTAKLDVTDAAASMRLVAGVLARFGQLDVAIANAGIAWKDTPATLSSCSLDEFEKIIDVDFLGVWRTLKAALPAIIQSKGQLLVTSSIYATINGMANAPYAASKAGVESLFRSLRAELGGTGASASIIYPGWTETPIARIAFGGNDLATRMNQLAMPSFLRKPIRPEQLATSIVQGLQKRQPHIIAPARWRPLFWLRGVFNPAADWYLTRHPKLQQLIHELESLTERQVHSLEQARNKRRKKTQEHSS